MKTILLTIATLSSFAFSYGQNSPKDNLETEFKKLQELNLQQKGLIAKQAIELKTFSSSIEYLKNELKTIKTKHILILISTFSNIIFLNVYCKSIIYKAISRFFKLHLIVLCIQHFF